MKTASIVALLGGLIFATLRMLKPLPFAVPA
jgi:hypothetical protein